MIVVMPLGYGDMSFATTAKGWSDPATIDRNTNLFSQALLTEVLPQVESTYNVSHKREDRAIAGLSMGGLESLTIGLTNTDKFAYVIGLSSAAQSAPRLHPALAILNPKTANLRLLWIACGTEDSLIRAQPQVRRLAQIQRHARHLHRDPRRPLLDRLAATTSSTSPHSSSKRNSQTK